MYTWKQIFFGAKYVFGPKMAEKQDKICLKNVLMVNDRQNNVIRDDHEKNTSETLNLM